VANLKANVPVKADAMRRTVPRCCLLIVSQPGLIRIDIKTLPKLLIIMFLYNILTLLDEVRFMQMQFEDAYKEVYEIVRPKYKLFTGFSQLVRLHAFQRFLR